MATAIEASSTPTTPGQSQSLTIASLLGMVYVVASLAVLLHFLPGQWAQHITPRIGDKVVDWMLWIPSLALVAVALIWFGNKLIGDNPPKGIYGGIFLMVCFATVVFLIVRAVGLNIEGIAGMILSAMAGLTLIYFAVKFFTGERGESWMVALEEQGWFSTALYKKALGQKVRRLTQLGIGIVGGTGIYSLLFQGVLPQHLVLTMPFDMAPITVLYGAAIGIPAILGLITLWIAWRAVNIPEFTEFLIATEAEMNKVSWSTRKRLAQDTVVVLITTLLMTIFLLVVDLFWGWLLSRNTVGVLPARATTPDKGGQVQEAKW